MYVFEGKVEAKAKAKRVKEKEKTLDAVYGTTQSTCRSKLKVCRWKIQIKACLYTYLYLYLYSPRTTTYLLQSRYELFNKTKKRMSQLKKVKREFSSRDRKALPSPERHSTMCSALQPNRQQISARTGGVIISRSNHSTTTRHTRRVFKRKHRHEAKI